MILALGVIRLIWTSSKRDSFSLTIVFWLIVIGFPPNLAAEQAVLPKKATYEQFLATAKDAASHSPFVLSKIQDVDEDTLVLFIPGILGSMLKTASGEVIWGKNAKPSIKEIRFEPKSPSLKATILDAYPLGVTRVDIYGKFKESILNAIGGRGDFVEFPYDWRTDLNEVADTLHKRLTNDWAKQFKNKRIIIVAHSMGGVVAWRWKNKYLRKRKYPFTIEKLVLLGVPLKGSCEMLRMLLQGYRPPPCASPAENLIYKFIFSELHPAAFTFQSVFELLPDDDDLKVSTSCLVIKDKSGLYPQRHFAVSVWENGLIPHMKKLSKVPTKLGLTKDQFIQHLKLVLNKAKVFRKEIDLDEDPISGKVEYFYSSKHGTTFQITMTNGALNLDIKKDGDGRVPRESAINGDYAGLVARHIPSTHGSLVRDDSFMHFINDQLKKTIQNRRTFKIAEILAKDSATMTSFAQKGIILGFSDLGQKPLSLDLRDPRFKAVLDLNLASIKALNERDENISFRKASIVKSAYEYGRYADDDLGVNEVAVALYEAALVSGDLDLTDKTYGLNRYGKALIDLKRHKEALTAHQSAIKIVIESEEKFPESFLANLWNNYGVANWVTGENKDLAIESWEKAVGLGSTKAMTNLERAKR
ncbi:MAG: hypothetical protein RX316_09670 [bacterium]|nr:hypothetical protein [bacterium]